MATIEGNGIRLQDATDGSDPDDLLLTGFIFPDNPQHTIPAFVYRSTKDRIQQSASNVGPPPSSNEPSFSIRKTKAAGKGLFATKALKIGDLIFSERPIVVTRAEFSADFSQVESYLQILFMRLPKEQQVLWHDLHNSKSPLEAGPLFGQLQTNGWSFDPYKGSPLHAGIFPTYARCNHSCAPNAVARFNHSTWSMELRPTRNIPENTEILVSYVDVLLPRLKRRAQLHTVYGFICHCKICSLPDLKSLESDSRREKIASNRSNATSLSALTSSSFQTWRNSADFATYPTTIISKSVAAIVMTTQEGLEAFSWQDVLTLYKIYAILGDEKNFKKWRTIFRDLFLANSGETREYTRANLELENPSSLIPEWNYWNRAEGLKQDLVEMKEESPSNTHARWEKRLLSS